MARIVSISVIPPEKVPHSWPRIALRSGAAPTMHVAIRGTYPTWVPIASISSSGGHQLRAVDRAALDRHENWFGADGQWPERVVSARVRQHDRERPASRLRSAP